MKLGLESDPVSEPDAASPARASAQLLSLAVHEFRTPASVVGGYLRMLQRDTKAPLNDRQRQMVEDAEKACAQMVSLVSELNELSRLDDPATRLRHEPLDLFAMVREIAAETEEGADRGVRLKTRGLGAGAARSGDVVRLHGAIGALLRSVLRQQSDDTLVIVDCRITKTDRGRTAVVAIAREEELAQALASAPAPFDDTRGGQGLALPIARRVIERHGGRLWSPPSDKGEFGTRRAAIVMMPV